jgi:hypothetical protein
MIKFFREIRQNLHMENKTGKYFKYAIGEIVLVVIGILIALQINNWNSDRISKNVEREYLIGISSNLSDDILELETHFKTDTTKLNAYTYLIRAFNVDKININDPLIITNLYPLFRNNWFEGQNVVFEDLKSSGKLNIITSDSIKHKVQTYYRFFEETVKREDVSNAVIDKLGLELIGYLPAASLLEPTYIEQWNGNAGPPNLKFIKQLDFIENKSIIIDNYSIRKAWQYGNHEARLELYNKAVNLKQLIENTIRNK